MAVYNVLGVDLDGQREILGHWVGEGGEGANFWLSVVTDLQNRGVQDVLLASIDGLSGFKEAIQSVFPQTQVQRCIIHQIRQSLKYVVWKDRKAFTADLKTVYQAATREQAEANLLQLEQTWGSQYGTAIRSWQNNWEDLATFFEFPREIRRLIYTTNGVEGYHRQLRKVIKTKGSFPTEQAVRKLLYLATLNITRKWTMPIQNWPRNPQPVSHSLCRAGTRMNHFCHPLLEASLRLTGLKGKCAPLPLTPVAPQAVDPEALAEKTFVVKVPFTQCS